MLAQFLRLNVSDAQIFATRNWLRAEWDPEVAVRLRLPENHNERLGERDLCHYDLRSRDLRHGFFEKVDLQSADVCDANLEGAIIISLDSIPRLRNWLLARYDAHQLEGLRLPADHNARIAGRNSAIMTFISGTLG
jgi:uncharacterized protein YjbI with pentapeptide repeats